MEVGKWEAVIVLVHLRVLEAKSVSQSVSQQSQSESRACTSLLQVTLQLEAESRVR